MKHTPLLPLFAVIMILSTSCGKIQDPEFRKLQSWKVKKIDFEKTDLGFSITYFNPNSFGLNVKEAEADFYVDSVFIGKFRQDREVEVKKNQEFSIPLSGSIPMATALKLDLKSLATKNISIRADGSVKLGKAGVFVTKPFTYNGKHKLDIHF